MFMSFFIKSVYTHCTYTSHKKTNFNFNFTYFYFKILSPAPKMIDTI